ncbi:glycosyltransferase family 2 protein [Arcanobacterium hippocoleae]|uniref:glycosyltransferase family 2 protein n=1 Tax=Arcanobacterium hippocoleae TaxID=149017 RepID=UPI003341E1D8
MKNFTPLVSVLVPCYNTEKYLKECIDSILSQSLTNIEIICINDGSTDTTQQILEEYAKQDSRLTVINKENSGYGAAMNCGLAAAKGEYIAILESDDFMEPDALTILTNAARQTNTPVVKANFYFYWSAPKAFNQLNSLIHRNTPHVVKPLEYPALFWYMPSIWSAIYRRDFLVKNEIRFLETPGASYQDVSFTFKVWACAEKVSLLPNAFVHYRQDNENSSIHSAGKVFAVAKEFAEIERFIAGFGPATPKHKNLKHTKPA